MFTSGLESFAKILRFPKLSYVIFATVGEFTFALYIPFAALILVSVY